MALGNSSKKKLEKSGQADHLGRPPPPNRVAKCHGFGGLIRVNFLEVWGKFFESVIRVFDVWVILPHAPPQLSNFTPLYRVTETADISV